MSAKMDNALVQHGYQLYQTLSFLQRRIGGGAA